MAVLELEAPETPPPVRRRTAWRQPRLPTLAYYLAILQSGWLVISLLTVAGVVGGAAYSTTVPQMWAASASVELPDVPVYVDLNSVGKPPKRVSIDTTGQLAYTEEVLGAISEATGMTTEEAADSLTVSAYPLSRVIILTVTAGNAEVAIAGANAAAFALVDVRLRSLAGSHEGDAKDLKEALRKWIRRSVNQFGYSSLSVRLQAKITDIDDNLANYGNPEGKVVNKARPAKKVPPHSEVYVTTGAVLGFMLGVAWIWWRPRHRGKTRHR